MSELKNETISDLLNGALPWPQTKQIMSSYKDNDRFFKVLAIHQDSVGWNDRILLTIGENLFIVQKPNGRIVKCRCGYEFGPDSRNWKLNASILVRNDAESLKEIYPHADTCDPEWMEIREFICPECGTLLEVEACTPLYPILEDFRPNLEGFYSEWLNQPLDSTDVHNSID